MESQFLSGLMATNEKLREALQTMMAEGEISFNFEGRYGGEVVKWVRINGRPVMKGAGVEWKIDVSMGDGTEGTTSFQGPQAESDILALVQTIADHFQEESVTN